MTSTLESFFNKRVLIITNDGRTLLGTFQGYDQTINVVLTDASERVFSSYKAVETVALGVYMIRGDNIAVVGDIDEELDSQLDFDGIRADPLHQIVH
ncbi:U6 snRNA-associated Sm-like protein LSm8 [Paramacrobiotus metropolitanus]|uniref:U6 snRNA-associated Sm-like protein LSm8 n=1 Tax=Paramacrobiotus metropolitanus TaxID=2943436 RepID=UPI0024458C38|nr:U6 snRNA-associated Sm-like protein LSm8 [Paramacrobiotus metropolitanus]XP_055336209.1 U6 snRNA-associated Sm-like protein LSm8 [Paramacrobiotus metropolitanus]